MNDSGHHPAKRLRVVQWATGTIGAYALRQILEHPDLELVGVWVHSPDKVGTDAGSLCASPPCGVLATSDVDHLVGLGADCLMYMASWLDLDVVCRFLEAGTNVVCTRSELHDPESLDVATRQRLDRACQAGGTSIHATGSSPGFISEVIPLALLSIQRRLDALVIDEFGDLSQRPSPELLFDLMGFGAPPGPIDQDRWAHGAASFGPTLRQLARAVGLPLDTVEASGTVALTKATTTIVAGTLPAGTVGAQQMTVVGLRQGRPLLTFRATWYCTTELDPAWEIRPSGWRITVDGDAPMDLGIELTVPDDRLRETMPAYTANRAVNSVAALCAAAPGLRSTVELATVAPRLHQEHA